MNLCSLLDKKLQLPEGSMLFHKKPPLVSVLSQVIPVHITPLYVLELHLNIILPFF